MDEKMRLQYRQGLMAISMALAPGVDPKKLQQKIMLVSDEKLIEITGRFGALAKSIIADLNLEGP